jgi:hypothetical protein
MAARIFRGPTTICFGDAGERGLRVNARALSLALIHTKEFMSWLFAKKM